MSIGKNIPHDSASGHVTGQSVFIDDRRPTIDEVYVLPVGVPVASGILKQIDFSEVLNSPGIINCYTAMDFHHLYWGTIVPEQPILVKDKIGYIKEPALLIVGQSMDACLRAAKKVQWQIETSEAILNIPSAIEKKSFLYESPLFQRGQINKALANSKNRLSGEFVIGGQEHFYLESNASIAYPTEDGQIEIHSSSQHPSETQHVVAHALGLNLNDVVCIVKRMGGGFGGKESQAAPFAAMAALVAQKLNRPARLCLSKDDDMQMTGKRHPFLHQYQVGFDDQGIITALDVKMYSDAGAYADLSSSILDRALFHLDGCYFIENIRAQGWACRTNNHSNTAFRGFGGPQGTMLIENLIEDISEYLKIDAAIIRKNNCYGEQIRNITHYGQVIDHNPLPKMLEQILADTKYFERQNEIQKFNQSQIMKTRGISVTGTKFGIAFTAKFLNQGNALVNVHRDGTVQVSTGATEMGQGVNTKIQQVVAHAFGIPIDKIRVMATSTEKNHNTSPTAASSGSDINAAAADKAAQKICQRLIWIAEQIRIGTVMNDVFECPEINLNKINFSDYRLQHQVIQHSPTGWKIDWNEVITKAYFNRISLGEYAHFKTENIGFDKKTAQGRPFNYFTNGFAISEVEIDNFTGEYKVLQTDILMDLGRPINPGIDHGQVTGAFIQGMGWVTTEKLYYNQQGLLLSHSPTTYKIPNIQDIPRRFNVQFINSTENHQTIHRSKAVGEPPFLLGISVWTALKNALFNKKNKMIKLESPATPEIVFTELHL